MSRRNNATSELVAWSYTGHWIMPYYAMTLAECLEIKDEILFALWSLPLT